MKTSPLSAELIEKLRQLQGDRPLYKYAEVLGVSRSTVVAALAGVKLHAGTQLLLKIRIQELTVGNVALVGTNATA